MNDRPSEADGWVKAIQVNALCPDCFYDFRWEDPEDEIWVKPCPWHKSAMDLRG